MTLHPRITERTTAGAAAIAPQDMPRDNRKRKLVQTRVFRSKRRSRYSIRGIDLRAIEERHQRDAENHHRKRKTVIKLHEAEAVVVTLACRSHQRNRAELRRHHREADRPPGHRSIGQKIRLGRAIELRSLDAIGNEPADVSEDDCPVDQVHASDPEPVLKPEQPHKHQDLDEDDGDVGEGPIAWGLFAHEVTGSIPLAVFSEFQRRDAKTRRILF